MDESSHVETKNPDYSNKYPKQSTQIVASYKPSSTNKDTKQETKEGSNKPVPYRDTKADTKEESLKSKKRVKRRRTDETPAKMSTMKDFSRGSKNSSREIVSSGAPSYEGEKKTRFKDTDVEISDSSIKRSSRATIIYTDRIEGCSLAWKDIRFEVKQGNCCKKLPNKVLLDNVTGYISRGQIMALMGPSGSGKTTLLDTLADRVRKGHITGEILINGVPRDKKNFRLISSYVSVTDTFYEVFTVQDTMMFAAALSLPKASKEKRKEMAKKLIFESGMESCAKTRIGGELFRGLSTGQKRRLSIATELLKKPLILFMDEPLSGLDGSAAINMMACVEALAKAGMTILMSVHQPPSKVWGSFQCLTLLTRGTLVFCGSSNEALNFLEASSGQKCPPLTNPPDYFLNLINSDFEGHADIEKMAADYLETDHRANIEDRIKMSQRMAKGIDPNLIRLKANYCIQTAWLTRRTLLNSIIHPGMFWFRLLVYVLLNFIVGTMFIRTMDNIRMNETAGMLFFYAAYMIMLTIAALPFLIVVRPVFLKERGNGLIDTGPYVIATFIGMVPGVLLIALVSSIMIVFMTGMNNFGWFFILSFLLLLDSEMFMYAVSTLTDDHVTGTSMASAAFGTFMICCGFLLSKDRIPGYWIWMYYFGFMTYGLRGLIYNQFTDYEGDNATKLEAAKQLDDLDMDDIDRGMECVIMTIYLILLFIVFTLIMQFKHTGRK